jgi:hypothetical protein
LGQSIIQLLFFDAKIQYLSDINNTQKFISEKHTDYFLKTDSQAKGAKERSMNRRFQEHFEKGLSIISASLAKKNGVRTEEKDCNVGYEEAGIRFE